MPGGSASIQIILVEKEYDALQEMYEKLGQDGLNHCKDKFLVQSVSISDPTMVLKIQKNKVKQNI